MKRIWAALAMILIAVGVSVAETMYLGSGAELCIAMLEEADAHMENNEIAEAQSLSARLERRFENQAPVYDIFLFHGEVLDISKALAALRRYAQTGDTAEYLAASARIKKVLQSIRGTRTPSFGNIF